MPDPRPHAVAYPTKDLVAEAAAARLLLCLGDQTAQGSVVHISITGGSLGTGIWEAVSQNILVGTVDWSLVHIWWSDERFLPSGDPERNAQQVFDAFFRNGPVPGSNLHVMGAAEEYADQYAAARAYADELSRFAEEGHSSPRFALSLLGMGPDGHIASLFPGKEEIHLEHEGVVGVENSPKPPPKRISMTRSMINNSDRMWFLVAGSDKRDAFERVWAARDQDPDRDGLSETPASGARGLSETLYLIAKDSRPEG
ncbi:MULTISPECIES: 6-phosphogluconolactonase [Micrococcaceae]|uniref:6-phosphogluconolactonase n=1 Tax=unclassified Kocuria TaxID=2649579 RepID=UPI001010F246|nr:MULTISPECIES: 6-phosphogluconolactonase [unclassified Kocuria]